MVEQSPSSADGHDDADSSGALADHEPEASRDAGAGADRADRRFVMPLPSQRLRRPPTSRGVVGAVLLTVLALVCVSLIISVLLKSRAETENAAREAAAYTPPAVPMQSTASDQVSVAVVSDDAALASAPGVGESKRWARLLNSEVTGGVKLDASRGAAYASKDTDGTSFTRMAERVPPGSVTVLFVGGANDAGAPELTLARAATEAFSAASQQAPNATIIAVGPLYRPSITSAQEFSALRATLRSSARIAGVRWVDPVSAGWLPSVDPATGLTANEERRVADELRALVVG